MSLWNDVRHSAVRFLLYAVFVGVLPIGISTALAVAFPHWPTTIIMTGLILAGFLGMHFVYDRGGLTRKPRSAPDGLRNSQQAGDAHAVEYETDLSATDIALLQRRRLLYLVGLGVVLVLVWALAGLFIQTYWTGSLRLIALVLASLVVVAGMAWVVFGFGVRLHRDIQSGKKAVIRGVVTRKFVDPQEDGPDHYFLELGTLNVRVRHYLYRSYDVGVGIEIHVFRKWGDVLLFEKKLG